MATLSFNDGMTLQVHDFILEKLGSTKTEHETIQPQRLFQFNFSSRTGHVVVHYLYTGELDDFNTTEKEFRSILAADYDDGARVSAYATIMRMPFEIAFLLLEFEALRDLYLSCKIRYCRYPHPRPFSWPAWPTKH